MQSFWFYSRKVRCNYFFVNLAFSSAFANYRPDLRLLDFTVVVLFNPSGSAFTTINRIHWIYIKLSLKLNSFIHRLAIRQVFSIPYDHECSWMVCWYKPSIFIYIIYIFIIRVNILKNQLENASYYFLNLEVFNLSVFQTISLEWDIVGEV